MMEKDKKRPLFVHSQKRDLFLSFKKHPVQNPDPHKSFPEPGNQDHKLLMFDSQRKTFACDSHFRTDKQYWRYNSVHH